MNMAELEMSQIRERIDDALYYVAARDAGEAYYIVSELLDATYRALKSDPAFANLTHDRFDTVTADVRERDYQELGEQVDGLCDLNDVKRAINHELDNPRMTQHEEAQGHSKRATYRRCLCRRVGCADRRRHY
jgi:hypothetical protein